MSAGDFYQIVTARAEKAPNNPGVLRRGDPVFHACGLGDCNLPVGVEANGAESLVGVVVCVGSDGASARGAIAVPSCDRPISRTAYLSVAADMATRNGRRQATLHYW